METRQTKAEQDETLKEEPILTAIESEERRLSDRFDQVIEQYHLYPEFHRGRYTWQELFRSDVEEIARHALAINADVIVFLDQSARGYGLLTQKMLPVIRLEMSKLQGIDPNTVILPTVKFIDPPKEGFSNTAYPHSDPDKEPLAKAAEEHLVSTFGDQLAGKKILLVDEASLGYKMTERDELGLNHLIDNGSDITYESAYQPYTSSDIPRSNGTTLSRTASEIRRYLSVGEVESHLCPNTQKGGCDLLARIGNEELLLINLMIKLGINDPKDTYYQRRERLENGIRRSFVKKLKALGVDADSEDIKLDHSLVELAYGIAEQDAMLVSGRGSTVQRSRLDDESLTAADRVYLKMLGFDTLIDFRNQVRAELNSIVRTTLDRVIRIPAANS